MDITKIKPQESRNDINVIIEIPMNHDPIKYEFDKEIGAIRVDRFVPTAMFYPCNYGFVPKTLSLDGDPVDVLVVTHYPVIPGAVIKCRPVGVFIMEDESGVDEKIIAVPVKKVDVSFDDVHTINDLNPMLKKRITHFFEHYKDLEYGKWVKVKGFEDSAKAWDIIHEGINRCKVGIPL